MSSWPATKPRPLPVFGEQPRWSVVPWALVILAVALFLPSVEQFNPQLCANESLTYGASDAADAPRIVRWEQKTTLLPSGQICGEAIVNGQRRTIENRSWLPPIAVALSLIVFLVGWIRPPTREWRNLAVFLTAPALMLGLFCLIILGDEGQLPEAVAQVSFTMLAFIALGVVPGFLTYMYVNAMREPMTHRLAWFFGSWAGWSALFASGFALAALT